MDAPRSFLGFVKGTKKFLVRPLNRADLKTMRIWWREFGPSLCPEAMAFELNSFDVEPCYIRELNKGYDRVVRK